MTLSQGLDILEAMASGVTLIARERSHQTSECPADALVDGARCYLMAAHHCMVFRHIMTVGERDNVAYWPWDESQWEPSEDPTRNLAKAGALIAAAIDHLQGRTDART